MYYVGVDIGGTFTDCVLVDRYGNHRTAKVLSTKDDPVAGVLAGLSRLAGAVGVDPSALLERTERFGHGTTIGTNAVLERRGARVGLVATAGHGDALAMMVTVTGRAVLAPAGGNFKDGCAVLERPLRTVAPEFATRPGRAGYLMRYREYLCPVTGLRVDSEIVADGGEALHDIVIGEPAGSLT